MKSKNRSGGNGSARRSGNKDFSGFSAVLVEVGIQPAISERDSSLACVRADVGFRSSPFFFFLVDFKSRISIDPGYTKQKKVFARVIEAAAAFPVSWPGRGSLSAPEDELGGFEADIKKAWLSKKYQGSTFSTERFPDISAAIGIQFKGSAGATKTFTKTRFFFFSNFRWAPEQMDSHLSTMKRLETEM